MQRVDQATAGYLVPLSKFYIKPEMVDVIVSDKEYYVFGKISRLVKAPSGLVAGDYYGIEIASTKALSS